MGCRLVGASVGSRYCGGRANGRECGDAAAAAAVSYVSDCKWAVSVILIGKINLAWPGCIRWKAWFVIITEEPTVSQWARHCHRQAPIIGTNPSACLQRRVHAALHRLTLRTAPHLFQCPNLQTDRQISRVGMALNLSEVY
jgi:hypothetical protein